MKEIHAYRNEDGTYRVDGIGETFDGKEFIEVAVKLNRVRISIEPLADTDGVICAVTIEEDSK